MTSASASTSGGAFPGVPCSGMNSIGMTVVFEPNSPIIPSIDVLFVHGFTGHPFRTWLSKGHHENERNVLPEPKRRKLFGEKSNSQKGVEAQTSIETYWPRDLLPTTIPDARVLTFGYDTKIRHVLGPAGSKNSVYDHAKELLQSLNDHRTEQGCKRRLIIFIAHSLGGIVVKEALRQSERIGGSHRQQALRLISESSIGIMFFGTPHRGADPRGFLQHIAQNVMETVGFTANKHIVSTLMPDSERLKELLEDFPPLARQKSWVVYSFQEQLGVKALSGKKVVEDVSSCIGDPGVEVTRGIESNHMDMCRFDNSNHAQYLKVSSAIRHILDEYNRRAYEFGKEVSPGRSDSPGDWDKAPIESAGLDPLPSKLPERDRQFSEDQQRELMKSLEFDQIDARLADLRPPKAKTCSWMLATSQYKEWKQHQKLSEHHGFFWIRGKPGSGKSIMMKYLFSKAKSTFRGGRVISFFFNAKGAPLERSTVGLYRSLLFQLLGCDTRLRRSFDALGFHSSNAMHGDWQVSTLKNILTRAIELLEGEALAFYIDALDECPEDEIRDMLSFFKDVGEHAVESGVRLHICFSSRRYPNITIRKGLNLVLEDENSHTMDIKMFIDSELHIGNSELVADIRDQVAAKASGVFLWVALVIPLLNKAYDRGKMKEMKKSLDELPPRLSDLIQDILLRDSRDREALLFCIQWVLFAKTPMKLEVLYFAVGEDVGDEEFLWDPDELSKDQMRSRLLDTSKGLVEETKSNKPTMQFIHESVRDFLLKEKGLKQLWPDLGDKFEAHSHVNIANRCLRQVRANLPISEPLPESVIESQKLRNNITLSFPFLDYATMGLLHHSNAAQALGLSQSRFMEQFPLSDWMLCHNVTTRNPKRRHTPDSNLLYILAEHDLASLVRIHPDRLQHFQIKGGRYCFPLLAALARGSRQVSRDLGWQIFLEQGVLIPDDEGYETFFNSLKPSRSIIFQKMSLLTGVIALNCLSACRALLSLGASVGLDPNEKDKAGNTIILGEILRHRNLYTTLLQYGLDAAAHDKAGRMLLSYAAQDDNVSAFEYIIKDFDARMVKVPDSQGRTPVSYAAGGGSGKVIKLLSAIEGVDLDLADSHGRTPLSYAAEKGNGKTALLLLNTGKVDPDSKDTTGRTPLSYAVENYKEEMASLLLETGKVEPDSRDIEGKTPLRWVVQEPWIWQHGYDCLKLLLNTGRVDPARHANDGLSSIEVARLRLASGMNLVEGITMRRGISVMEHFTETREIKDF